MMDEAVILSALFSVEKGDPKEIETNIENTASADGKTNRLAPALALCSATRRKTKPAV